MPRPLRALATGAVIGGDAQIAVPSQRAGGGQARGGAGLTHFRLPSPGEEQRGLWPLLPEVLGSGGTLTFAVNRQRIDLTQVPIDTEAQF